MNWFQWRLAYGFDAIDLKKDFDWLPPDKVSNRKSCDFGYCDPPCKMLHRQGQLQGRCSGLLPGQFGECQADEAAYNAIVALADIPATGQERNCNNLSLWEKLKLQLNFGS